MSFFPGQQYQGGQQHGGYPPQQPNYGPPPQQGYGPPPGYQQPPPNYGPGPQGYPVQNNQYPCVCYLCTITHHLTDTTAAPKVVMEDTLRSSHHLLSKAMAINSPHLHRDPTAVEIGSHLRKAKGTGLLPQEDHSTMGDQASPLRKDPVKIPTDSTRSSLREFERLCPWKPCRSSSTSPADASLRRWRSILLWLSLLELYRSPQSASDWYQLFQSERPITRMHQ